MNKLRCTLVVLLQLTLSELGITNLVISAESITGEAGAPVYKRGETWSYRVATKYFGGNTSQNMLNGEYEITLSPEGRVIWQIEDDRKIEVKDPTALILMLPTRAFLNNFNSKAHYFQFPLVVGKKWKADYYHDLYKQWITPETTVVGIESVTTPAGVFSAYRIEREFYFSKSFPNAGESFQIYFKEIYFYSPQIRSIVNYHWQREVQSMGDLFLDAKMESSSVNVPCRVGLGSGRASPDADQLTTLI